MKVLLLGPATSIHLRQWAAELAARGMAIHIATQHPSSALPAQQQLVLPAGGAWGLLRAARVLAQYIAREQPDIVHAHYASRYGLLSALASALPAGKARLKRLLTVWGSDVFAFADRSPVHRLVLRCVLRRHDAITGASLALLDRARAIAGKQSPPVHLTPFGVDTERFRPLAIGEGPNQRAAADAQHTTLGTVKTLAPTYGIDILLRAFALLLRMPALAELNAARPLRLLIVGDGPQRHALHALASELGIAERTEFAGAVPHAEVPQWLRRLNVYIAASRAESFGVAVLEASACGIPVIASRVGGLPEVVQEGRTGLLVESENPKALAEAMADMLLNAAAWRTRAQAEGPPWVEERFGWPVCSVAMVAVYDGAAPRGAQKL